MNRAEFLPRPSFLRFNELSKNRDPAAVGEWTAGPQRRLVIVAGLAQVVQYGCSRAPNRPAPWTQDHHVIGCPPRTIGEADACGAWPERLRR